MEMVQIEGKLKKDDLGGWSISLKGDSFTIDDVIPIEQTKRGRSRSN